MHTLKPIQNILLRRHAVCLYFSIPQPQLAAMHLFPGKDNLFQLSLHLSARWTGLPIIIFCSNLCPFSEKEPRYWLAFLPRKMKLFQSHCFHAGLCPVPCPMTLQGLSRRAAQPGSASLHPCQGSSFLRAVLCLCPWVTCQEPYEIQATGHPAAGVRAWPCGIAHLC